MGVHSIQDITAEHVSKAGGKAASLGELARAGHPVPAAFVITADERVLSPQLVGDILAMYDRLALQHVAVRSSGIGEDGRTQSWAGQFATLLHINRDNIADAVQACWDSANAGRVKAYGNGATFDLAVLVQQMVRSQASGVAFSANPITGYPGETMVEAMYGLGELLVQGLATPDNYVINKLTGQMITQDIATKPTQLTYTDGQVTEQPIPTKLQGLPVLTATQLQEITALATNIERHYGYAVDIEWAIQDNTLYLLQARPITTL